MNRRRIRGKYIGVFYNEYLGKYGALIKRNKRDHICNGFDTEIEAAEYRDKYIKENNFNVRLNFPDPEPENPIPNTRLIRLTQGKFAVIDEKDYERVSQFLWHAKKHGNTYYAYKSLMVNGIKTTQIMHNFILGPGLFDHVDMDGLHNYRTNLRACTSSQNSSNRVFKDRVGYRGVRNKVISGKYQVSIMYKNKNIYLGAFYDKIEAAKAYDTAAIKYFGEFARLNFPIQ